MKRLTSLFLPGKAQRSYADAGDFLRVFSVAFVGWFHIWQQSWLNPNMRIGSVTLNMYPLVACGYMFVDLMLLLSGFLLMLGYLSGRVKSWKDFYIARAARILPSYLLCIAVVLFCFALPQGQYGSAKHMWTDILSHLSFNFYIWHQFLAVKLKDWRIPHYEGANPNQAGLMPWQLHYTLVCFIGALALSLAITYLVEKPCGRWIKRKCT